MKFDSNPPAIVAQAEPDDGVKSLAKAVSKAWTEQRQAQDKADAHGLEIGRLVCEYAERADTQARVAVANEKKNGRPKAAHCWVAEEIVKASGGKGPSIRHLERCARAYLKAQKNGLPINTPIRVAEASDIISKVADRLDADGKPLQPDDMQPSPERLFEIEAEEGDDDEKKFDPEREALTLAKKIQNFFYTPEGHPKLRTKAQKTVFAKHVNKTLETIGIDWEFFPKGAME